MSSDLIYSATEDGERTELSSKTIDMLVERERKVIHAAASISRKAAATSSQQQIEAAVQQHRRKQPDAGGLVCGRESIGIGRGKAIRKRRHSENFVFFLISALLFELSKEDGRGESAHKRKLFQASTVYPLPVRKCEEEKKILLI